MTVICHDIHSDADLQRQLEAGRLLHAALRMHGTLHDHQAALLTVIDVR